MVVLDLETRSVRKIKPDDESGEGAVSYAHDSAPLMAVFYLISRSDVSNATDLLGSEA